MRRLGVIALVSLPACAAISGLDGLDVGLFGDAGALDATADATADVTADVDIDVSVVADAGPVKDAVADAPVIVDATPAVSLSCGPNKACAFPAQVCCHRGTYANPVYDCESPGACSVNVDAAVFPIPCDRSALCGNNTVCCGKGTFTQPIVVSQVTCANFCGSSNSAILCGAPDAACPQGLSCALSQSTLPGFYVCK